MHEKIIAQGAMEKEPDQRTRLRPPRKTSKIVIGMELLPSRFRLAGICEPSIEPIRSLRVCLFADILREMHRYVGRKGVLRPRDRQISLERLPFRLIVRNPGLHWGTM